MINAFNVAISQWLGADHLTLEGGGWTFLKKKFPASSVSGNKNGCKKKCREKNPVPLFMQKKIISSFRFCHIFRPESAENGVLRLPIFKIFWGSMPPDPPRNSRLRWSLSRFMMVHRLQLTIYNGFFCNWNILKITIINLLKYYIFCFIYISILNLQINSLHK